VIVSPSAILTAVPSRTLAAAWEDETEMRRSRSAKRRDRRDRGVSRDNSPKRIGTLWGKRDNFVSDESLLHGSNYFSAPQEMNRPLQTYKQESISLI